MATTQQEQAFLAQYGPLASQAANNLGLSQSEVLGQWALETGWGTQSSFAAGNNNPGNVSPGGSVANYPNANAGVAAYESTLSNMGIMGPNYANNISGFALALQNSNYAGNDANYATNLAQVINQVQAMQGIAPAASSASTSGAVAATKAGVTAAPASGSWMGWLQSIAGSWGTILLGAVMIIGALMLSQKETIVKLGEIAG